VIPVDTVAETVADKDAFYRGTKQYRVLDYARAETQLREAASSPSAG
jgi:hypothetical protein